MQKSTVKSGRKSATAKRQKQHAPCDIEISIPDQELRLRCGDMVRSYPISTSRFGLGTEEGSLKTPLGKFKIAEQIGQRMPIGSIFRGRVPLPPNKPLPQTEDFVTSRILWLDGLEDENANTKERFIYIH